MCCHVAINTEQTPTEKKRVLERDNKRRHRRKEEELAKLEPFNSGHKDKPWLKACFTVQMVSEWEGVALIIVMTF